MPCNWSIHVTFPRWKDWNFIFYLLPFIFWRQHNHNEKRVYIFTIQYFMSYIFVAVMKYLDPYLLKQRKIIITYSCRGLGSIMVGIIGRRQARRQKLEAEKSHLSPYAENRMSEQKCYKTINSHVHLLGHTCSSKTL